MRVCAAFAALLIFVGSAQATDFVVPEQTILGAEAPIPLGDLVDLSISPIRDKPAHYVSSSYAWKVLDLKTGKERRVRELENGVIFGSGIERKVFKVYCVVTHIYAVRDGDKTKEIGSRTVWLVVDVVIGDGPEPPPPPPGPDPVFPDGKYKLAKFCYDAAMSKVVADNSREKCAKALANSFRSMAAAGAAGTITSVEDMLKKTKASNDAALKNASNSFFRPQDTVRKWETFSEVLQEYIYSLYQSNQMQSISDFVIAWREIADGLDRVK